MDTVALELLKLPQLLVTAETVKQFFSSSNQTTSRRLEAICYINIWQSDYWDELVCFARQTGTMIMSVKERKFVFIDIK